jgi:uncharacterized circularly permuted ATP-grasp superfamily protein
MIRYYLNEDSKKRSYYQMENLEEREFVFADMGNMVIKETNGSGYGMVMGNKRKEIEDAKIAIVKNPRNFIAQPIIQLSTLFYRWRTKTETC